MLVLRLLLAFQLALSSLYLVYAVFITDACWTTPCLSSDFTINVLRVSVSASVSSVVFGALNVLLPVAGLYMLWRRVKTSYYAGLYNGAVAVNALLALLQCITWGEQYTDLLDLNSTDILMYGSQYALNARLRVNAMAMSTMCGMLAVVGSILSLALMRMREFYCVDLHVQLRHRGFGGGRSVAGSVQQYHTVAVSDDPELPGADDDEVVASTSFTDDD